ncbi:FAD-dependent oxidoreductase (plasmid) [Cupriavidus pinatubonensis]|nr:FAD-dependent oxidoreductase [Cupriavidus pinatubonensis]
MGNNSGHRKAAASLDRRGFMRQTGLGAGAIALGSVVGAPEAHSKPGETQRKAKSRGVDYDVIVLGGGFAGITAARESSKNGYRTLVLEARDRLGGRTYTSQFAGHMVELGGTWIHWTQPFVWAEVQRYKLDVIETPESNVDPAGVHAVVLVDGRREYLDTPERLGDVFGAFNRYFADAGKLWERPYDAKYRWPAIAAADRLSASDVVQSMKLSRLQQVALDGYLAGLSHCPPGMASHIEVSRWWALPGGNLTALRDAAGRYRFKDGTISLINAMVADGKPEIRLSTPVRAVEDLGSHAVVTTQAGQRLRAASVIVGLPMNVLPGVQFSPPLDASVVAAGQERHAGRGVKLLIKVKGRVADTRVLALADPTHPLPLIITYAAADDHTVLVMFGPDPKRIDYQDKAAVQQALRDFFPDAQVEEVHFHPWTEDPYSLGTWANYRPGWFEKYYAHFQQDRGRVIFGQGDHGEGWRGFIDGAIGAGIRAAERAKIMLG